MNLLQPLKRRVRLLVRSINDLPIRFARKRKGTISYSHSISIVQEIKPSATFDNKVYNLSRASEMINAYDILPDEIFSFWRMVGNPDRGFKKSRSIQKGKITEDAGGGICQVAGIIYHASLLAGLPILERHNHSMDIYTDETRFTPLGLDATVVFGYKDLRFKNVLPFPIRLKLEVKENQFHLQLLSTEKIETRTLSFKSWTEEPYTCVSVTDDLDKLVNTSRYGKG